MLIQGIEPWRASAVHDTVAVLLKDAAYRRSFWSSIVGRLLTELGRLVQWLYDAVRGIPGGKTTVLTIIAIGLLLILGRLYLAAKGSDDLLLRRKPGSSRALRSDPWAEAESLAAAGDYMGAAHALYQAVIRRLAATERIRPHSSKTSGDYARELRRRGSPLAIPFQTFGRRFDRVVFGAGVCTADDYAAMRRDALEIPDRQAAA
ncbi:MAG: DUF4129 domain-containing protein [Gemmatimonadaceae bacterium]